MLPVGFYSLAGTQPSRCIISMRAWSLKQPFLILVGIGLILFVSISLRSRYECRAVANKELDTSFLSRHFSDLEARIDNICELRQSFIFLL